MKKNAFLILILFLSFLRVESGHATDLIGGEGPKMLTPQEALEAFTMAEGFSVNLWASEEDSPIQSPTAMTFDSLGRLWVTCIPSHPHAKPNAKPRDSIVVFEDTDRDGVSDKSTVFYDELYLPMGIAVEDGGKTVYVCSEPNLLKISDPDGDLVADDVEIVLHGFGTEDNHHFISAFQWGPDGRLFFGQGLFLNTQVETPHGPVRAYEGNVFRFDPRNHNLENFASFGWSNPWGIIFDHWGQGLLADASPALNYYLSHTTSRFDYPKGGKYTDYLSQRDGYSFTPSGRRPSCGNELLLSEHFPEEVRGWYVTNQMKGWHGVRWYRLEERGSSFASDQPRGEEELLTTSDITFRPTALQLGPDGALYVLDYYNPIVGHTTYNFRDPRRVQTHGRVWRITAEDRPLAWQPPIHGEEIEALLELLKSPNYRWRYFARRELQQRDPAELVSVVRRWIDSSEDEHDQVEALWLHQGVNHHDLQLLKRLLGAKSHDARTAAVRVLRYWQENLSPEESLSLIQSAIGDESQRVRLEALVACGFHSQPDKAIEVAARALEGEMDPGFELAARETFTWLKSRSRSVPEPVETFLLPFTKSEDLLTRTLNRPVAEEILRRKDISSNDHQAALGKIGSESGRSALEEMLFRLGDPDWAGESLSNLLIRLLDWELDSLEAMKSTVEELASTSGSQDVRAHARAALLRLGTVPEWTENTADSEKLDTLKAIKLAGRGHIPVSMHSRLPEFLKSSQPMAFRLAAIEAVPQFPEQDAESLRLLAVMSELYAGKDLPLSFTALESMKRIPKSAWPEEYSGKVLNRIRISATADLKFDTTEFTVPAGSAVELTFFNPDNLYHNLVIVEPNALERVGTAADLMAGDPKGLEKHYVPDDPGVLHWTRQLTLGVARSQVLRFYAPDEPGDYPYICTFPGHWRVMRGIMRVE